VSKVGAYPIGAHFRYSPPRQALGLLTNIRQGWKGFAGMKPSLFGVFISDEEEVL